jgi:hypothetical protein
MNCSTKDRVEETKEARVEEEARKTSRSKSGRMVWKLMWTKLLMDEEKPLKAERERK